MSRRTCCLAVLVIVGVVLIVAGVVFIPVSKKIIHNEIKQEINLNSKDTYDNWVKNPTPIFFQAYFWDLTNPNEVQQGTEKPSLSQKGPYTYRENRQKIDIQFTKENSSVTYKENSFFIFDREMSIGPETDTFTTVNVPMMLVVNIVKNEFSLVQEAAEALLEWSKEDLFVELTVKDFLWGYVDPLLNKTVDLLHKFGINVTLDDHFGVFVGKNGSDDGWYNIKTGADDPHQFGQIQSWNFAPNLTFWTTPTANMLNGTDGTIFNPFVEKSDVMYIYSSDLCRSIYATYDHTTKVKDIEVYRFSVPREVFLNASANPANLGYCYPDNSSCLPSGLLDVETCQKSAPLVFSQPHFLNADPRVIASVDGVHPNDAEHNTIIDIEPNTGAAFMAAKKLQVNIQLENVAHLKQTEKIKPVVLPVLWLNESSAITDDLANEFKSKLVTPQTAIHAGIYVAIGLGVLMLLGVSVFLLVNYLKRRKYQELQDLSPGTGQGGRVEYDH